MRVVSAKCDGWDLRILNSRRESSNSKKECKVKLVAPIDANLSSLTESDFESLSTLARTIWMAHYTKIIGVAQIEYMLAGRFTVDNIRRYVNANDRWLEILKTNGEAVGYCSYALTEVPGEMKLEQLYLLPALHGRGLG